MQKLTERGVQIALGILWLLDGALQLQHQMFTSSFANKVIIPAASGQPLFVRGPMHLFIHVFLLHPAVFNTFTAVIQLGLGVLILHKRTIKLGLMGSVAWGLFVWYIGEGLGGLASWQTLLLVGAPGAALLYVILALAVMPKKDKPKNKQEDKHPAYWLAVVWAALWVGGAVYQLLPGQDSVSDVSSMISSMANGAPGWLASLNNHIAQMINGFGTPTTSMAGVHMTASQMARMSTQAGSGYWFILLLATVQLCIGLGVFFAGRTRKIAIGLGILASVAFWIFGQALGRFFTGLATDPNSAPLFILLGIAILGVSDLDANLARLYKRTEIVLVGKQNLSR